MFLSLSQKLPWLQGKSSANVKQFADFDIAFLLLKRINFNLNTEK